MKRKLGLFLASIMVMGLVGCGNQGNFDDDDDRDDDDSRIERQYEDDEEEYEDD